MVKSNFVCATKPLGGGDGADDKWRGKADGARSHHNSYIIKWLVTWSDLIEEIRQPVILL